VNPHDAEVGLSVFHLGVSFRDSTGDRFDALSGITAQFKPGQVTAIVGPSGSGKTTLLHCIAGILVPSSGETRHGGVIVSSLGESARDTWRRHNCGMVFQDFRLIDELTVLENVTTPAMFGHYRVPSILRDRARTLIRDFGLPERSIPTSRLSRGERQRVALARALLMDPAIILADEPTASLDRTTAASVAGTLEALATQGKAVVCVTHDDLLVSRAHEVIALKAGRMGPPAVDQFSGLRAGDLA
jgi:putative ABC transport system ATP-binding protein